VGGWKSITQGMNRGSREDHVSDLAETHQEDSHILTFLLLNDCLIDKHDRDVVLDGVDPMASATLEPGAVLDERDGRLAVRTSENFEQFRVNGHAGNI